VGIDLGTTYSAVASIAAGAPEVIRNSDGDYTTPSVLYFDGDEVTLGVQAENMRVNAEGDVVSLVKRQMGNVDFVFVPDSNDNEYRAEDLSALILSKLVANAEDILGEEITDVVVTVPAYFEDAHRNATRTAAEIAGLKVLQLINEPTAAALSYGLDSGFTGNLLVYDLGGGTFDVTVLRREGNEFKVLSSMGDRNLGGFDFNNKLFSVVDAKFTEATGSPIPADLHTQVLQTVEDAKRRLSQADKATVFVSALGQNVKVQVTREEFEAAAGFLLKTTEFLVDDAVEGADLEYSEIDKVILVGGSTRMPMVAELVEKLTGQVPDRSVHPDQAVALGAAIIADKASADKAGMLPALPASRDLEFTDVISHGVGMLALNPAQQFVYNIVLPAQSTIPSQVIEDRFATSVANQRELNLQIAVGDTDGVAPNQVEILGESLLKVPPGRPANSPLRVVFSADIDGMIHIQLIDLTDGISLGEMEVKRPSGMSPDQVERARIKLQAAEFT
jgi:molecular chaperone DnaK